MKKKIIYSLYILSTIFIIIYCFKYQYMVGININNNSIKYNKVLIPALILSLIVTTLGVYIIYKKRQPNSKKIDTQQKLYGENPLEMSYIYNGYFPENQFYITFLNLIKKGVLKITKENIGKGINKEKTFISIQEEKEPLEKYEIFALDIFKRWIKEDENNQFKIEKKELFNKIRKDKQVKKLNLEYEKEIEKVVYKKYKKEEHIYDNIKKLAGISMGIIILAISIIVFILTNKGKIASVVLNNMAIMSILFTILISKTRHNKGVNIILSILAGIYMLIIADFFAKINCQILILPFFLMFVILQYAINLRSLSKKMVDQRERIRIYTNYIQELSVMNKKTKIKVNWEDSLILAECLGIKDYYLDTFDNNQESTSNLAQSIKSLGNTYYEFKQEFKDIYKYVEE